MFKLLAKIYIGRQLVKYEVLNLSTNTVNVMSVEMVHGIAMTGGLVNAQFNESTRSLVGINGHDLRTLPRKQEKPSVRISSVFLQGSELVDSVNKEVLSYTKERFLVNDLMSFLNSNPSGKICALYGLRRTGKTVMMFHAIKHLFDANIRNVVYVSLTPNDSLSFLFNNIKELVSRGIRYLFLDEITAVDGFVQSASVLSDIYAKMGVHIVISGTDSYILSIAEHSSLYDRMLMISTTYIGYKEYSYISPKSSILDYIHIGGVLVADVFYNYKKTKDYITTAISDNIISSLLKANNTNQYQRVMELHERGLLKKAIEQEVEASNKELTVGVITKSYRCATLGSAKQLMLKVFNIGDVLNIEEVEDKIRYKLSIVKDFDAQIDDEYIRELKEFLISIGVIKIYHKYVCIGGYVKKIDVPIFVQPGLRYNQTVALLTSLCDTVSFFKIEKKYRKMFWDKIISDVEGNLIEHEVLLSSIMKYNNLNKVEVTQLTYESMEVDMIIHNGEKAHLFEIKRSSKALDEQAKWLVDNGVCSRINKLFDCDIVKRSVLYLGTDTERVVDGEHIKYQNINEFLKK